MFHMLRTDLLLASTEIFLHVVRISTADKDYGAESLPVHTVPLR